MATGDSTYNSQVPAAARPPAKPAVQGPTLPFQQVPGGPVRRPAYNTGLPFGSGVPSSPLTNRYLNSAQNAAIPDRARGTFAGMMPAQLGPGVGYVPTYYDDDSKWRAYLTLDANQKKRFEGIMDRAYPRGWSQSQMQDMWSTGIMASDSFSSQGRAMTPLDALEMGLKSGQIGGSSSGGGGGGGGGGSSSSTTVQYNITDPETAERLINSTLSVYLGRAAKPHEQAAFYKALNRQERANPNIQETASATGGGHTSTQMTQRGGMSREQFAEDWSQAQEGAAEYQASTKFLSTFMSALENPMDVVT